MKEFYRSNLPHFQQPGQIYFVTWNLKDAIPSKVISDYSDLISETRINIEKAILINEPHTSIEKLKYEYHFYRKRMINAYEEILHRNENSSIDISTAGILEIIENAVSYWQNIKISNIALCVMPNHVHWVFKTYQFDQDGNQVWLQDILKSVKNFSARNINNHLGRSGILWHKESWDTTVRGNKHLHAVIEYIINNPVKAGLAKHWKDWKGTYIYFD